MKSPDRSFTPFSRRKRALAGCAFVVFLTCVVWASGLGFQTQFTRESTAIHGATVPWDWTSGVDSWGVGEASLVPTPPGEDGVKM